MISIASSCSSPCTSDNLGSGFHSDVRFRFDLLDEVVRHARCKRLAPHEECHRSSVVGEEDGGLTGRIARTDQIHVVSLRQTGVAACGTVVDTGADESIDRIDLEAPPFHAHREHDRLRSENVTSIQPDGQFCRVDGFDPARHDNLGAQPLRLLQCPARELIPRDADETRCSSRSGSRCRPARPGRRTRSAQSAGPRKRC